jgi:C4-type Zn-finger protein
MMSKIDGGVSFFNAPPSQASQAGRRTDVVTPESKPETTQATPAVSAQPVYGFRLRVDQETKEVTVVIVDPTTKSVIREIPSEEMRIASDVIRNLLGPLVDKIV